MSPWHIDQQVVTLVLFRGEADSLQLTQFAVLLNQVHLREDVDVGKLHVQHGGQGGTQHRDELGRVSAVMRVHKVHCCQLKEENSHET